MIDRDKEREDAMFIIPMCVAMILLLFLALYFMYHENVWSIVIIFALLVYAATKLVYAGPKKSATGIIAAWIGVVLLLLFLARLGPTPQPHHVITGCLMGLGPPPTAEAQHAWCLTQQASWTPTPLPWWQFWGHPVPTATP